jgi:hypothetical protein
MISEWRIKGSGLHRHHIIPRHAGGKDCETNYTYLTVREHIIAHFLLWKMFKNPNDLRSMHMLGANLTVAQRRAVGKFCWENKIGFYEASREQRAEWNRLGVVTQIKEKIGIHNPANYKLHASIGGKASIQSDKSCWKFWASNEGRVLRAHMGAQALKGRIVMHAPGSSTFVRVEPNLVESYLSRGFFYGPPDGFKYPTSGRKVLHIPGDTNSTTYVSPNLVDDYLAKGYSLGYAKTHRKQLKRQIIHHPDNLTSYRQVPIAELDSYLNAGYILGKHPEAPKRKSRSRV